MTHEENMQMQDAVRNGVITYEQYIDWLRQADPNGLTAPSREYFNNNSIFGGLGGGNGLADFVQMIGAIYGQNPVAYQPENPPIYGGIQPVQQQPQVGIGQNPYSQEQVQAMRNSKTFMPHPAQWVNVDYGGGDVRQEWRPESTWNSVGSFAPGGGSTSVDWRAQALQQAQAEIASGKPSQWALNIVQMQQNDPSWVTTGIQEAQGYLNAANSGMLNPDTANAINQIYQPLTQQFGAVQAFADQYNAANRQQNTGWTPYTNYPNNWQPNPQYQTQPYPSGGGASVGFGQPYQLEANDMTFMPSTPRPGPQGTMTFMPSTPRPGPQGTMKFLTATQTPAQTSNLNKNQQVAKGLNPNLARYLGR